MALGTNYTEENTQRYGPSMQPSRSGSLRSISPHDNSRLPPVSRNRWGNGQQGHDPPPRDRVSDEHYSPQDTRGPPSVSLDLQYNDLLSSSKIRHDSTLRESVLTGTLAICPESYSGACL